MYNEQRVATVLRFTDRQLRFDKYRDGPIKTENKLKRNGTQEIHYGSRVLSSLHGARQPTTG